MIDHPLRYTLANELHARPFPSIAAPCQAVFLAMTRRHDGERDLELAHLIDLLDRFGTPHPQPNATHFSATLGRHTLKWESHTEFVTYTIFATGKEELAFNASDFSVFPDDWLAAAPGRRITSAMIRVEQTQDDAYIAKRATKWLVPESMAMSRVLDGNITVAADFRIDSSGHIRIVMFSRPDVGPQRIGRVVQRLCEIETYKTMAMLGFSHARSMGARLAETDARLSGLVSDMSGDASQSAGVLEQLLDVSGQVEIIGVDAAYRFAATAAYAQIVDQRIDVLREERFQGWQTFGEFMMRRFDPAMRTVTATERRLHAMSDRALRVAELLRTKVDVDRSAQNQALLSSMDKRADLQLRLQKTVEGLSVIAVSYYAVNIALYMLGPLGAALELSKTVMAAGITPVVVFGVWLLLKRVHKHLA